MKKIYLVICLMICALFQAQIVNIPDPLFKAKLVSASTATNFHFATNSSGQFIKIDTNNNGEIEVSEANSVWGLNISDSFITDLTGIQSFSNLNNLKLFGFDATTLNFSGMTALTYLQIQAMDQLTGLNITNCTSLQNINISIGDALHSLTFASSSIKNITLFGGNLTQLNVSDCPALQNLSVQAADISTLDLSNLTQLTDVNLSSVYFLQNINFQGCSNLYRITLNDSSLTSLNLSNLPSLWKLAGSSNNGLTTVSLSNCPAMERIELTNNTHLANLNTSNLPSLLILDLFKNKFTTLNVSSLPSINYLRVSDNLLETLDLSQNPSISSLECTNNKLKSINLKNGSQVFPWNLYFGGNPQFQFICCDDEDITNALSQLSGWGITNVVVNSYCSFTPGGTFYTIQGNTKYDSNNNGCDISDPLKAFQKFDITNGTVSGSLIANNSGNHTIAVGAGSHIITPVIENPAYFNISPSTFTANFPTQTSPLTQNFCLTANGVHNDLEVAIIPVTAASPGFNAKYKIIYKNKGTTTQSGTISLNYNDNVMDYLTATVNPNSQSTGLLNWNFTNLLPFETREITVTLKLNTPTQTPPLNGGAVLNYTTQINGATDETPSDNTFTLNQTVVNSFDPNDKTCLEGSSITQAKVGDYVHYLIRFENTGTANAQNIVVKDDIDGTKFDLSSLVALNGSHNFITRVTGNVVEFIFENIQLPFDTATNDGYVSFKIKTKSTLNLGDSFSNKAGIYFDYNAPIITNNYTTTVQNVLGTSEISKESNNITIYPNPVKDVLNIQFKSEIAKAEIYDVAGRILISTSVKGNYINVSELTKGNYIIKLSTKDKIFTQKFIKN